MPVYVNFIDRHNALINVNFRPSYRNFILFLDPSTRLLQYVVLYTTLVIKRCLEGFYVPFLWYILETRLVAGHH